MILSIHVPKAAGNSFRQALNDAYGDRFMKDYGDWAGFNVPEANERRAKREQEMRARRDELAASYDIIHGHFIADKYRGLFEPEQFIAFFRDPFQQAQAHYYFLERNPQREHPEERIFHENKMTFADYMAWDAFRDHQTQFLGSLSIDDLAFAGLSEEYEKSLALFKATFDKDLGAPQFLNVNESRGQGYPVDAQTRALVLKYRAADVELYEKAKEKFRRQACVASV
jgi:hypothetical protein